jgi:transcriptional regulator ATRX
MFFVLPVQVITFVHTMLVNVDRTKLKTCLVLCPLNTILNWQAEFENWLEDVHPLDVSFLEHCWNFF